MPPENPIYIFPRADNLTIFLVIALFLAILVGAFLLEMLRRRRDRKLRLQAEWRAVEDIVREKELSADEQKLLAAVIRRRGGNEPFRCVTVRYQFDRCVEEEMEDVAANGTPGEFEQRGLLLRDIRTRLGLDYVAYGQRIHSTRELYRGQVVWVSQDVNAPQHNWVKHEVVAVDEAYFRLAPQNGGRLGEITPGTALHCKMWREEDARYLYTVNVVRVESPPTTYVMQHTKEFDRLQAREHFRVRHEVPTEVEVVEAPASGDAETVAERPALMRLRGYITSLSGGGFAVVLPQPLPKQVMLRAELDVGPAHEPAKILAHIVGSVALSGGRYLVRGAYAGVPEEVQDAISAYVVQLQQHQLHQQDEQSGEAE